MSIEREKISIIVILALVSVLLLGGLSFTFFPSQIGAAPTPQVATPSTPETPTLITTAANSSLDRDTFGSNFTYTIANKSSTAHIMWTAFRVELLDSIVITPDGTVNSTAIRRDGDTYTFIGDVVNQTLVVQRSNIAIDGANHSLRGFTHGTVYALENIHLENITGVTIRNLNISDSWQGITVLNCTNIAIQNNTFTSTNKGVYMTAVGNSSILDNTFGGVASAAFNDGVFGFSGSSTLTVSNNTITNAVNGVSLAFSSNNTITDNVIVKTYDSIYAGVNATIARNTLVGGIDAISGVSNDRVYDNTIINFTESGILLSGENSIFYQNTIENCSSAIVMDGSSDAYPLGNNTVYHNNFINNTQPLLLLGNSSLATTSWDDGKEGNYWSSYRAADANGDDIGDQPYSLGDNNTDRYPLMQQFQVQNSIFDFATAQVLFGVAGFLAVGTVVVWTCFHMAKKWTPTVNQKIN